MSLDSDLTDATPTISFDKFWDWVTAHPNCILRAGTREVAVYDDDDFHWHFAHESAQTALVQVIRGKRLVGEILIPREEIAYVQGTLGDHEGEFVFDLVGGDPSSQATLFFFVLTHGYEAQEDTSRRRIH